MSDRHISEDITWFGSAGRFKQVVASESLTCDAATETTSGLIPADVILYGVCVRVTTACTGAATFDVGDGSDPDRWGDDIVVAEGTTTDISDWTDTTNVGVVVTSATEVTLTPDAPFTAGEVLVTAYYLQLVP